MTTEKMLDIELARIMADPPMFRPYIGFELGRLNTSSGRELPDFKTAVELCDDIKRLLHRELTALMVELNVAMDERPRPPLSPQCDGYTANLVGMVSSMEAAIRKITAIRRSLAKLP